MKWIPVKERLPEYDTPVLVTIDYAGERDISIDYYSKDYMEWMNFDDNVVAWAELPDIYRGEFK